VRDRYGGADLCTDSLDFVEFVAEPGLCRLCHRDGRCLAHVREFVRLAEKSDERIEDDAAIGACWHCDDLAPGVPDV
jgi:hypothetical protein